MGFSKLTMIALLQIDSFINIFYPLDPKSWLTKLTDVGALQKALEEDFRTALPPYVTEEYIENWKKYYLQKDGLASPNQWYTVLVSGLEAVDESSTFTSYSRALSYSLAF